MVFKSKLMIFFLILFLQAILSVDSLAATVVTKYGERTGKVIVRESMNRQVVTIVIPEEKRLFQFYAQDVKSVTAEKDVLIKEKTALKNEPTDEAEDLAQLSQGMEIEVVSGQTNQEWIKIKAWGNLEGWIRKEQLTNEVFFTSEVKKNSSSQESNSPKPIQKTGDESPPEPTQVNKS